ncbi:MAG: hypothetical protein IFK94_08490 [Acidobacteria bacterium]|uniref:Uncharacterized protein n=1 Tax=Candidatus Polarisedimenticola svalbardensis TaxID=2886004 RepID=A0A8J6Y6J8_9BACT|nr:hypothetical protein [Candidatus Polarisedimenticola svalbardensis]
MSGKATRWLKGCGCTLAVLLVVGVIALVVGSMTMIRPLREAIETREQLDLKYGSQSDYTPPADGAIPRDRLEQFLTMRRELMEICGRFEEAYESLEAMERFDSQDTAPNGEVLRAAFKAARGAFGLAPAFGDFIQARNQTLLDHGVGLGEYTYIYSMAYGSSLLDIQEDGDVTRMQVHVSRRVLDVLQDMLERQLDQVEPGSAWADTLKAEVDRLEGSGWSVPWINGLPPTIDASLAPFRTDLEEQFCRYTVDLELAVHRTINGGIGIQGD